MNFPLASSWFIQKQYTRLPEKKHEHEIYCFEFNTEISIK
ncbi:type III chaperone protein ShcF, partial [Pseudomonas syringae pv. actinidiae]|nr:type III chaperone protein ShcF [Pseudomonas syringae pv. actinidiae]